ncbi:hypothetical protein EK21DRAFT_108616 [Setomelanomma holmii]|uniref:Uncharacterized protein n=1 Tax=Setomelanomma holmii TaxID=210430 RepID=A0A9P4LRK4_9PLEO|nr:hypothetical protein EK21DRAFT_108616 [Setomelanomma holmii]
MASHSRNTDVQFDFFGLPRELRDMIYDGIWNEQDTILEPYHNIRGDFRRRTADNWRARFKQGLPPCLWASKQFLEEAMALFFKRAHWNVWPVRSHGLYRPEPSATILSLSKARSISIGRMPIWARQHREFIDVYFDPVDEKWLHKLGENLSAENALQYLALGIGTPCLREPKKPIDRVVVDLAPVQSVLASCPNLDAFKVEIFGFVENWRARECLDAELLQGLKELVAEEMGDQVHETSQRKENLLSRTRAWDLERHRWDETWKFEQEH